MRHAYAIGLIALIACSTAPIAERTSRTSSAIINGTADTTHTAVVALLMGSDDIPETICSGTIIKIDAASGVGWVATAAHCVNEAPVEYVYFGTDYANPNIVIYPAIDSAYDHAFDVDFLESGHDFAIVRFAGATANMPFIPLASSPDGLAAGTSVTSVGFGQTSRPSQGDSGNTARNVVTKTLDGVADLLLTYDGQVSGGCFGDSGGPLLVGDGANMRVVGIHSYESGDCNGEFGSGRVSAALQFYATEIAKPLPAPGCAQCRKFADAPGGTCAVRVKQCFDDPKCKGFYDCYNGGGAYDECVRKWPLGEGPYSQMYFCPCTDACATECKTDAYCMNAPKCGFAASDACDTCVSGACCAEETECSKDPQCFSCFQGQATACPGNDAYAKFAKCALGSCASSCTFIHDPVVDAGAPSSSSSSSSGDPTPASAPVVDAGAPAAAPAPTDDGGCNSSGRSSSESYGWLALALVVLRLRPYRSARR